MILLQLCILLVFHLGQKMITASNTNFEIKRFEVCNNTQGLIKFHANVSKERDSFYINGIMILPISLDDNTGLTWKIESLVAKTYVELFTIREKNACKAANTYLGEFWYDIERSAQVMPRTCPLSAGRYEAHHSKLDCNKMALQTFPFGHLRFTIKIVDNKHPRNNFLCLEIEVDNIPD